MNTAQYYVLVGKIERIYKENNIYYFTFESNVTRDNTNLARIEDTTSVTWLPGNLVVIFNSSQLNQVNRAIDKQVKSPSEIKIYLDNDRIYRLLDIR